MPEIIRCPACNKETYLGIPRCPHCSEPFEDVAWSTAPSQTTAEPTASKHTYEFRPGSVFTDGFPVFFKNILPFSILGIIVLSPLFLFEWLLGTGQIDVVNLLQVRAGHLLLGIGYPLLNLVLFFVLTAAITSGTFQALRGYRVSVGDCLSWGLSRVFHVFGISIVTTIVAGFALLIVIVPAMALFQGLPILAVIIALPLVFIAIVRYCVAVPATVVERTGILESLERSIQLTSGCRLGLFVIGFACAIIVSVFQAITGFLVEFLVNQIAQRTNPNVVFTVIQVITFAVAVLVHAFMSVMTCVAYFELRRCKEGLGVDELAEVFA